jgi:cyclin K
MQATAHSDLTAHSQWLFPISALSCTPTSQERSLHEEMYDRSRGIEFLYRLGTSIGLFVLLLNVTSFHMYSTLVP